MLVKNYLKKNLSFDQMKKLKRVYTFVASAGQSNNLDKLARIYKTDKGGDHYYTQHYKTHFRKIRLKRIQLLEIGVGGYDHPELGGASLRMWKRYFPFGRIYACDLYDKSMHTERRIRIFQGDQNNPAFLAKLSNSLPDLDIIIDDGSHINAHVIHSFIGLFPKLKNGGIYVIEDTQTSYWKEYGGDSKENQTANTSMNFFKSLCDGLNYKEFRNKHYVPDYFDLHIKSIHFYHNLIFIHKGVNSD